MKGCRTGCGDEADGVEYDRRATFWGQATEFPASDVSPVLAGPAWRELGSQSPIFAYFGDELLIASQLGELNEVAAGVV
jgi:hypothetical protein